MSYLDVAPMMSALRTTPEEFSFKHGVLKHGPSRHSFAFHDSGNIHIRAECNCAYLSVRPDQRNELNACFQEWQANYWRPMRINKEFASHFRPRSPLRRLLIGVTARFHSWLLRADRSDDRREAFSPAE